MQKGDRLPFISERNTNKTIVATLNNILFECKYFIIWDMIEIDGYYKDIVFTPKTTIQKNEEMEYLEKWYNMNR